MKAYKNRSPTAAEVIAELAELAKEMKIDHERGAPSVFVTTSSPSTTPCARTTRLSWSWATSAEADRSETGHGRP